ncbi:glycine cleavage system protein GcvH [Endozoicomonas elysicola]|uniref:Glycine cleavage system H protein n=1 Tax=Endozoicomonas elysicola TaxID=305900 RepID=A0A081K6I3_9GAMM|nr:glycine cleavage system protein GcvH [Endozoicomonas elysicola]KEI69759.1 glycine cleavage system protein H [Endozoicomonas elysicola]
MSNIPSELRYLRSHEWVRLEEDGTVTIGITDHAQESLGDVVFVELPEPSTVLGAGDEAGAVESVKAASEIYAPLTGEIVEINEILEDAPETVNSDPYNDGWFFKMKLKDDGELGDLLDAEAYAEFVESEA